MATLKLDVELRWGLRGVLPAPVVAEFSASTGLLRIAGPSGTGKSTLLAAIAGVVPVHRGLVSRDDVTWSDSSRGVYLKPERRNVGWVPQGAALFPHLSVLDNIRYGCASRDANLDAIVQPLHIRHLLERPARALSGGEASRVALARAIARKPHVLLLDEPFAALDKELRAKVSAYVRSEVERLGCIAILVEHDDGNAAAEVYPTTYMMRTGV